MYKHLIQKKKNKKERCIYYTCSNKYKKKSKFYFLEMCAYD